MQRFLKEKKFLLEKKAENIPDYFWRGIKKKEARQTTTCVLKNVDFRKYEAKILKTIVLKYSEVPNFFS